jgi:hypothetical protein
VRLALEQYLTRGMSAITRSPLAHVHLKLALSGEHTVHECAFVSPLGACSRHDFFSAPKQRGGSLFWYLLERVGKVGQY